MSDDRARQLHDDLEAAVEAIEEHERIRARLSRAEASEEAASQAAVAARQELGAETADVDRLESYSPARIWATLRGRRDTDLDRERAEQQAAEYAVARAEAWLLSCHGETERLRAELAVLGDVAARRDQAMAAKEEWLRASAGPAGTRLVAIADEHARLLAEDREICEAIDAADAAVERLRDAARLLGSAADWAAYDTFGGGTFTDAMKYDRMDRAQWLLHAADQSLRQLAVELRDVGVAASLEEVAVDKMTRTIDVWFDNIFTDWAVRDRITAAGRRTEEALQTVRELRGRLAVRHRELSSQREALRAEREQMLMAPPG